MKKIIIFVLIVLLTVNHFYGQTKGLSISQKIDDFNYLYSALEKNYPFFGVNIRQNNLDWLSKKKEYIERIKQTKNDRAYFDVLKSIISELNSGHVSFMPVRYYDAYLSIYKKASIKQPIYKKWAEILEIDTVRPMYWAEILQNRISKSETENNDEQLKKTTKNYSDTIIDNRIAVISVQSFNKFKIKEDEPKIKNFLEKIKDCKYLIINIQNNSGGATSYWKNNIVSKLITAPIIYNRYMVIKNGDINRSFFPNSFVKGKILTNDTKFKNIPSELLNEEYYLINSIDTISPNNPIRFDGEIFLLVAKPVFSSSEGFAQFCKSTNWATVAGEQTGGDGNGRDPIIISLPESGILLIYPALVGLNSDGSLNFETKTTPDVEIKANTPEKRLEKLIKYLNEK